MTPAALDVARRLAAHPRMALHPRMAVRWPVRWAHGDWTLDDAIGTVEAVGALVRVVWSSVGCREYAPYAARERLVPDLDDPATAGVVLGMLAEATRVHPTVTPTVDGRVAVAFGRLGGDPEVGDNLGEAAGRALLAVWGGP